MGDYIKVAAQIKKTNRELFLPTQHRATHEFDRRVLLAVAGTTPQILTEALYALSQADTPFVPAEFVNARDGRR